MNRFILAAVLVLGVPAVSEAGGGGAAFLRQQGCFGAQQVAYQQPIQQRRFVVRQVHHVQPQVVYQQPQVLAAPCGFVGQNAYGSFGQLGSYGVGAQFFRQRAAYGGFNGGGFSLGIGTRRGFLGLGF